MEIRQKQIPTCLLEIVRRRFRVHCRRTGRVGDVSGKGPDRSRGPLLSILSILRPPVVPFYLFLGEGSPTKVDYRKERHPYSNLSTGGPTIGSLQTPGK